MDTSNFSHTWRRMSEEIQTGMAEWRQQNPKATFREIETELDRRLSDLRARMLTDLALASASTEWEEGGQAPVCPQCGAKLKPNGKKHRKLHTRGGRTVELEREYGTCPHCGQGIFPPG
jgi:YgiT-type zinc finger domain-containing protein